MLLAGLLGFVLTHRAAAQCTATITASGPTTFCQGGAVTLSVPAVSGSTYQWSTTQNTPAITVTQSGTYSVTVTTAAGCTAASAPVTVTVNPTPNALPTTSAARCGAGSVSLEAHNVPPGGTRWYDVATGGTPVAVSVNPFVTPTLTATTTYYVSGVNAAGCEGPRAPVTATINPLPTTTITASGPTTFCQGGSVMLTASGGTSYQWSTGATTPSITVAQAGAYSVTATNAAGCSATSAATTVTISSAGSAAFAYASSTYCLTGANPTPSLTGSAGGTFSVSPAGLSLNPSTGQINLSASTAGTYTITYTVTGACAAQQTQTLTLTTAQAAQFSYAGGLRCAGSPAAALPTLAPGSSIGTVTATPSGLSLNAATGAIDLSLSQPGTYAVTNTLPPSGSCAAVAFTTSLTVGAPPSATITASGPTAFCQGSSVTLAAPTGTGYLYQWSTGATSPTITVTQAGTYSVTVTAGGGCSTTSAPTTVTVNPAQLALTVTGASRCGPGSVSLEAHNVPSGGTRWYTAASGGTPVAVAINPFVTPTLTTTTTYYVSGVNAAGCEGPRTAVTGTINPLPNASVAASGPTTFCQGGSVTLTASGGGTYLWSTGATTPSITASTSGSYSVTVTNAAGCAATPAATTVTVTPLASAAFAYPTSTYCANAPITPVPTITGAPGGTFSVSPAGLSLNLSTGQINLAASAAGTYAITYRVAGQCPDQRTLTLTVTAAPAAQFSYGGIVCAGATSPVLPTLGAGSSIGTVTHTPAGLGLDAATGAIDPSRSQPGTYTLTNTIPPSGNCAPVSATTTVTVQAAPTAAIAAGGPTTFCQGGAVTLTASGGTSYQWSTGATTPSITVAQAGAYSVTATNAAGCAATSAATTVTVNPQASAAFAYPATTYCLGAGANPVPVISGTAGGLFIATPAGLSQNSTTGEIDLAASVAGTYSIQYTVAGPCPAQQTAVLTLTAAPVAQFSYTASPYCAGAAGTALVALGTGAVAGTFAATPAGLSLNAATGSISLSQSQAGTYTVTNTVAGTGPCAAATATTTLTVLPPPGATVAASGPTAFCQGGSVVLSAPAGAAGYQWNTGATTPSITVTATGTYSVTVTNAGGCAATSAAIAVAANPLPAPPTVTQQPQGGGVLLTSSAATGNQWYLNGAPIAGATAPTYVTTQSGSYTVVATSAAGCASPASAAVSVIITGVAPERADAAMALFPNPATRVVYLRLAAPAPVGGAVRLLDAVGRTVRTVALPAGAASLDVELSGLPPGIYFVRYEAATLRLIVE